MSERNIMLDMNLRELILCAASQHRLLAKQVTDAVRHRVQTHPEEVNQQGLLGLTPCHLAAIAQDADLLEILVLQGKADLTIMDNHDETPIEAASSKAIKERLVQLARVAKNPTPVLHSAASAQTASTQARTRTLSRRFRRNTVFSEADKLQEKEFSAIPSIGKVPQYKKVPDVKQLDFASMPIETLNAKMGGLTVDDEVLDRDVTLHKSMPKQRYITPLLKALNAERLEFILRYLQEGYLLQDFTEQNGSSALFYTFKMGLSKVFAQLLLHGASLRTDNSFNQFRASLTGPITHAQQSQMLIVAQNTLLEKIDWDAVKKSRVEIQKLAEHYNELLSQHGLHKDLDHKLFANLTTENLDSLAKEKVLPLQLLKDLYRVCSCLEGTEKAPEPLRKFNPMAIANMVVGISTQYNPFEVTAALLALQAHFSRTQNLIMFYVLKEIITSRVTYGAHDLKELSAIVVPTFFKEAEFKEFQELLQWMALLRTKSYEVELDNYAYLESLIQHHLPFPGVTDFNSLFRLTNQKTDNQAAEIAAALRSYSLMLFHNLDVNELTSLHWSSPQNKHLAPSVCAITQYFNRISNWITSQILNYDDINQRARYIKLCIKTANALIESEVPDYNSAMAIFSALNQAPITRLTATLGLLDRKTRRIFEKLNESSLSPHRNYQSIRTALESNRYALPYFGVVTADLTFSQENKNSQDRALIVGKVANALLLIKQSLKPLHLPITTNLGIFLEGQNIVADNALYQRSLTLEPRPFILNDEYHVNNLKADLATIRRNCGVLKVHANAGVLEGKAAFASFVEWLKKGFLEDKLDIAVFEELATAAYSIVSTDAGYKFNAAYYQTLKQMPQPIIVQFQRSSVNLNTNHHGETVMVLANKEPEAQNVGRKQF